MNQIKILEVAGAKARVVINGSMEIWLDKAMLRQYGVPARSIKAGAVIGE